MPLKWSDELSTGVNEIDAQHKELLKRLNMLREACREGRGKEIIDELILFLEDYIKIHFGLEERYMKQYNYPGIEFHIAQHRDLEKRFKELKADFEKNGLRLVATLETNELLGQWWLNHISRTDKELGRYLRDKMV
ncbi:MAG: bacteriohemerythrin [Thermodesulfovibrionales bacterium]|nr:bacteriohemerythrin [Thermodesulfovibrionales bacterium]